MTTLNTALAVVSKVQQTARLMSESSLIEQTEVARVEPLCLVDSGIRAQEIMPSLMNTVLNLFSGFYLQAISIQTQIGSVQVRKHLDQLNPNRDTGSFNVSFESLPTAADYRYKLPNVRASLEAASHNTSDVVTKEVNLAVGKVIDVTITVEDKQFKIPVMIRLATAPISPKVFISAMSIGSRKNTFIERWHRMRAGELTLIGDLLWCNDLIDTHKSTLKNDTSGFYAEMHRRRRNNKIAALRTEKPSLASASTISIISTQTATALERELGGKLNNVQTRNALFGESGMMLMIVADTEREMVTFYYRGIPTPTVLTFRELKGASKGSGDDIMLIMKALLDNKSPAL